MNRVVINVEVKKRSEDDVEVLFGIDEPDDVTNWGIVQTFPCDPDQDLFVELADIAPHDRNPIDDKLVKKVGEEVFNGLSTHQGVREAIDRAVHSHQTNAASPWPLYIKTPAIAAEMLPWEVLYHPDGEFLSLDSRWPIARMIGGGFNVIERQFDSPVRCAIVLGAAHRDATPEWEAIRHAFLQSGLDYEIVALVAQPDLQQHIEDQGDVKVRVEHIPLTEKELIDRLDMIRPNFLHIFCHGSVKFDNYLEIATKNHLIVGGDPVYLTARNLSKLQDHVWLVTLDACEGAAPSRDLRSYTSSLVKEGVPAAIGMREPIESQDSSVFCGEFYQEALKYLDNQISANGGPATLSWEFALSSARSALCGIFGGPAAIAAAQHKPWTLPVLYRKPGDFRLLADSADGVPAKTKKMLLGELRTYRSMRAGLPPTTPQEVRDQLDALIEQTEQALYDDPEE